MVVIGERPVDFVVVQFANAVDLEDCQEVVLEVGQDDGEGVVVEIDAERMTRDTNSVRAKL